MEKEKDLFRGIARQYNKTVDSFRTLQKDCEGLVRYASKMIINPENYAISCCLTNENALVFRFKYQGGTITVESVSFVEEFFRHGPVSRKALKRLAI